MNTTMKLAGAATAACVACCAVSIVPAVIAGTSLAAIGYVMLHTTALSLGDREVADLAHRHLKDHARSVMRLHNVIPSAVIAFLQHDGLPARTDVLQEVSRNIETVWRDESGSVPEAADIGALGTSRQNPMRDVGDRI